MITVKFEYEGQPYEIGVTTLGEGEIAGDFIILENDEYEPIVAFEAVNTPNGPSAEQIAWIPVQGVDSLRDDQQFFYVQV